VYLNTHKIGMFSGYANKLLIPYDRMLGDSFVKGKVVSINTTQKEVCLENDKKAREPKFAASFLDIYCGVNVSWK